MIWKEFTENWKNNSGNHISRCYMDPIMQKHGPTPDQKLRKAMYESLDSEPDKMDTKQISILGSDFALDQSSDLERIATKSRLYS